MLRAAEIKGELFQARKIKPDDLLRVETGDIIKVLCSNPERQSSGSGSSTQWHIEGYAEGKPTYRIICDPAMIVEKVGEVCSWRHPRYAHLRGNHA